MKGQWFKYTLEFKAPAGTSRGVLRTKDSYFIQLKREGRTGLGECGLLRGLSADDRPDYEARLQWLMQNLHLAEEELYAELREFPSIQAGLEMAILDLKKEDHVLFPSDFTRGKATQAINGLIWMGDHDYMMDQLSKRLDEGFKVLKMKIGAIDLNSELGILTRIRERFPVDQLELRVDANGAFNAESALPILEELAKLDIHSIEQPIKAGQHQDMAQLCKQSPLPIALDEELIGVFSSAERRQLIKAIKPQYIILKPSFIGGFRGSQEWINLAREENVGWWVTSALESNLGLSAIAQWNHTLGNDVPSGLGTGSLYTNNFTSPLYIENGSIGYEPNKSWEVKLG